MLFKKIIGYYMMFIDAINRIQEYNYLQNTNNQDQPQYYLNQTTSYYPEQAGNDYSNSGQPINSNSIDYQSLQNAINKSFTETERFAVECDFIAIEAKVLGLQIQNTSKKIQKYLSNAHQPQKKAQQEWDFIGYKENSFEYDD